jgi:hypothetical protein
LLIESRYWRQMLRHRFFQKFQMIAQKEFFELKKRSTFSWIEKANQSRILLIWVFKYKFNIDDYLKKFKTRLCVKNDLQSTDQNTYAITLTAKTFRVLMTISIAFDLKIWQYDAISAFINNEIDEELYSECPNEFSRFDYCWKLNKTLYELKQVSILWYRNLITIFKDVELQSISRINCLFVNDWLILFFYVDDIVTICLKENRDRIRFFEKSLMKKFEIRILEKLKWFLEIRIIRDRDNRKIWLCQNSYISKMMTEFHLEEMKISKTSLAKILRTNENAENSNWQRVYVFQQRIKSLNFAAIIFRFDIVFATAKLAQFLKNSNSNHIMIVNRMTAYLNDTKNFVIEFSKKSSEIFLCASDATFADDELIRKSSNDYLFKLYDDSIDWRAIKQVTMTTFNTETKLLILSRIAKKAIWWRRFFESIQYDSMKKLHIRCDNRQILRVLKKEMLKLDIKLKHVDIHKHWLRQEIQTNRISVNWCSTAEMSADDFIKMLSRQKHEKFLRQLHLIDITHLINQKKRSIWASRCQTERICWKIDRWSDAMISWDDEMNWWDSESRANRRTFLSKRNLFDQMIWSSDLISWILSHYIIIQFFMHERLDHESHLLIWDDSYRQFLHQYIEFESSLSTIIQSRWFIQVEMISFISTDFRDRREMSMRYWWDQIAVTTEFEDDLIRRENLRDERRSRFSEGSRWIMRWEISR